MTGSTNGKHRARSTPASGRRGWQVGFRDGPQGADDLRNSNFARQGGLLNYKPHFVDMFRGAAGYVDRILRGDKPADLPVQLPTRYDFLINLKTARALGLTVPPTLPARRDRGRRRRRSICVASAHASIRRRTKRMHAAGKRCHVMHRIERLYRVRDLLPDLGEHRSVLNGPVPLSVISRSSRRRRSSVSSLGNNMRAHAVYAFDRRGSISAMSLCPVNPRSCILQRANHNHRRRQLVGIHHSPLSRSPGPRQAALQGARHFFQPRG